jgi:hypothetical protein
VTYSNGFRPEWWTEGMIIIRINRKFPGLLPGIIHSAPIPTTARSKAWVCGRWLSGIAGWDPAGGMDVSRL